MERAIGLTGTVLAGEPEGGKFEHTVELLRFQTGLDGECCVSRITQGMGQAIDEKLGGKILPSKLPLDGGKGFACFQVLGGETQAGLKMEQSLAVFPVLEEPLHPRKQLLALFVPALLAVPREGDIRPGHRFVAQFTGVVQPHTGGGGSPRKQAKCASQQSDQPPSWKEGPLGFRGRSASGLERPGHAMRQPQPGISGRPEVVFP